MDEPSEPSRLNPFISLWLRPRATIRHVLHAGNDRWNVAMVAFGSTQFALLASDKLAPYNLTGLWWMAFAALCGVLFWLLRSWAFTETAKVLGGSTSTKRMRRALAWSTLVWCLSSSVLLLLYTFISLGSIYAPDFIDGLYEPESVLGFMLLDLPLPTILLFSVFVQLVAVSEATGFDLGLAWLSTVMGNGLSLLVLIVPGLIALAAYTVLFMPV